MATTLRRRRAEEFEIHEDVPSTEDTEMNTDALQEEEDTENVEDEQEPEEYDDDDNASESSDDGVVDNGVQIDMEKLQNSFPGFRQKYRLIKRIGEGSW